jgi:hypothetical protein
MLQPFVLLFTNDLTNNNEGQHAPDSMELVRLVEVPEHQHIVRDIHATKWVLEEVL